MSTPSRTDVFHSTACPTVPRSFSLLGVKEEPPSVIDKIMKTNTQRAAAAAAVTSAAATGRRVVEANTTDVRERWEV